MNRYSIDKSSADPAYMQLYRQLRDDIVNGYYSLGDRIPSKRLLAEESGTSVITTDHTLSLLYEEGYIEIKERSGCFVIYKREEGLYSHDLSEEFPIAGKSSAQQKEASRLSGGDPYPLGKDSGTDKKKTSSISEKADSALSFSDPEEGSYTLPSSPASAIREAVEESFPFSTFAKTMRRVLSNYGEAILTRSPNFGTMEFRSAIANYLARARGILVSPDQILIGSGSEYMYSLIVQMLGREQLFGIEDPSYDKIRKVYEANGVSVDLLKMGHRGITSQALQSTRARVLHVTPYHSYPTGITADASKRAEYIRWAKENHAIIIEDDMDSEFTLSTKAEDTIFSLAPDHTVIYMNTFTRTISPSIRCGYMVLPASLADALKSKIDFYSCTVPVFDQYVIAEFIANGDFERHINRVRRMLRRKL